MAGDRPGQVSLPPSPSPWPWVAAAALTGLVVGSLFQGYARTGVGFFRMFATMGVVWIGFCATRALAAAQQAAGLGELAASLSQLPLSWQMAGPLRAREGGGYAHLAIAGPHCAFLVALERSRSRKAQRRQAAQLALLRRRLESALGSLPPTHLVVCPLPAPPGPPFRAGEVWVVPPARLAEVLLQREGEPDDQGRHPGPEAEAAAERLRRWLGSKAPAGG